MINGTIVLVKQIILLSSSFLSFFVVEDHVLHTTQGLVNRAYVEELWELALSKIIAALRTHSVCIHILTLLCTDVLELQL